MTEMPRFVRGTNTIYYSNIFEHTISGLTRHAVAILDIGGCALSIGTDQNIHNTCNVLRGMSDFGAIPQAVRDFRETPLTGLEREWMERRPHGPDGVWVSFTCQFECGVRDRIFVFLDRKRNKSEARAFLSTIWPILRADCIIEAAQTEKGPGEKALLWMISDRIDVGVLVMNAEGVMLKANAAAKELLDNANVLRRTPRGIRAIDERETRKFREAIAACAKADPEDSETVLFLETSVPGRRSPVILARFVYEGEPTDLVTILLPTPPEPRCIEIMAEKMGLTPAEARVAALLQTGLSNREAAKMAGLKEQSFSTYAKRALSKLNVRSRAEMAQLLTWQARGSSGPVSRRMKEARP